MHMYMHMQMYITNVQICQLEFSNCWKKKTSLLTAELFLNVVVSS